VKKYSSLFFFLLLVVSAIGQEPTSEASSLVQPFTDNGKNFPPVSWNQVIGSSNLKISRSTSAESLMGNFVCDAILSRTETDFAFISFGELYADIFRGDITELDMFRLFPFSRTLVVFEMSGDTIKQILEKSIGAGQSGLAISGGKVEYDQSRPTGNRLTYVQVGEYPLYPKKEYRVVTIDYLADGLAGFDMLTEIDPVYVFRTGVLLRDTLSDYIRQNSPLDQTKVMLDGRWVKK
jgi:2',3'-cyclic-nucleotide 2'-phosphodiesterase (5'-nucleotidase family)